MTSKVDNTQSTQSTQGAGGYSPPSESKPSADDIMNAAMDLEISMIQQATDTQSVQGGMMAAIQANMLKNAMNRQKMLAQVMSAYGKLLQNLSVSNLSDIKKAAQGVPTGWSAAFSAKLESCWVECGNKADACKWRQLQGPLSQSLTNQGSTVDNIKSFSDNFKNGASSVGQTLAQEVAELSTLINLMTDGIS